jgi:hypothetical protein
MLAPKLDGDEILRAAKRFFPWRLMPWQIGPLNAECRTLENGKGPVIAWPRTQKRSNTMDDNNPNSETPYGQPEGGAATAARMKLSEKAAEAKEKFADLGRKTVDNIDESRKSTASALEQTAAKLHSGAGQLSGATRTAADQLSGVAHGTADKLQAAADYIRATDLRAMGEDVKDLVKRYPGPALAAAAVLGFVVARSLRRD